jgi:hypothetical protein
MAGLSGQMWQKDCSAIRHFKGLKYPEIIICIVQLSYSESWLISQKALAFHASDCLQLDVLFLWFKTYSTLSNAADSKTRFICTMGDIPLGYKYLDYLC